MRLLPSKPFQKSVRRLPASVAHSLNERLELFIEDPFHPLLRNHSLSGEYKDCRSINITGDYRLIFSQIDTDTIRLLEIDTHHNLYGT